MNNEGYLRFLFFGNIFIFLDKRFISLNYYINNILQNSFFEFKLFIYIYI